MVQVRALCSEISKFDSFELISDACLCHCIIRALRKEFMPFISLVQGWVSQPSIIELENPLSNHRKTNDQQNFYSRGECPL